MHPQLWLFDQVKGFPLALIFLFVSHCTAHTVTVTIMCEIHVGNYMDIHQVTQSTKPTDLTSLEVVNITTNLHNLQLITSRKVPQWKRSI
jgi:hypothetical protein